MSCTWIRATGVERGDSEKGEDCMQRSAYSELTTTRSSKSGATLSLRGHRVNGSANRSKGLLVPWRFSLVLRRRPLSRMPRGLAI
ncbi:uncharacterized protein EI97DRAFT_299657 [Westerdykella ornata]|uniref:Uncharacterized protein n=1 Tax=Westerdykella ornata TaxID=318751 RepID=A0A6A6JRQ5_WESOR|nr:uncharacterized protein EI97DRAFT_299657 [Westerdykella ornata]KAF2277629.1 hypothetical protein EI97DRAFT_299657 [Westerdykella ornata]